jgi:DNA-binding LytR/AlgR family response regulator
MKCLIVDDEPLARQLIESYIQRVEALSLVKSCSNAIEAFAIIQQRPVDLVFLDIQMPQITGIDLLRTLKQRPRVILTTAYREYAVDAYDLDVTDYLLKPILFERFLRSISKIYQLKQPDEVLEQDGRKIQSYDEAYMYLKEDREMIKVFLKDILYIESLRDYVRVKTPGKQIVTYQKISYLEQKLPESKFIRVHRSFIIALDKVSSFSNTNVKLNTFDIPIGRNYKNQALSALNKSNALQ